MDTSVPSLSSADVEQEPAQSSAPATPSLSSSDVEMETPANSAGPVNPYAKPQQSGDWRDALTQPEAQGSRPGVVGNIVTAASNFGAGALTPILHPIQTIQGALPLLKAGFNQNPGEMAEVVRPMVQGLVQHPAETIEQGLGQATTGALFGEAAGAAYPGIRSALQDRLNAPMPEPGISPPAAIPARPATPSGGGGSAPTEPTPAPTGNSTGPNLPPQPGLATQSDFTKPNVVLEQDPTPAQINARLLDQIVSEHPSAAPAIQDHVAGLPAEHIAALRDAVAENGKRAADAGDDVGAAQAAHADITLSQILEETASRPDPLQIGATYIESVKAGIAPKAAAAALGITPEHQELAHVAEFFAPSTMSKTAAAMAPPAAPASPAPVQPPAPPPNAIQLQNQAQAQTVKELAGRAAGIQQKAEDVAAGIPLPKPPQVPNPQGMDQGALTQATVDRAGRVITSLPLEARPVAQREAVGNLAKWGLETKTPIGPDGMLANIDSPKAAQTWAVGIINAEVQRQAEVAQAKADAANERMEAMKEDAKTAQAERDESLGGKSTGSSQAVEIPDTPQTQKAKQILEKAPAHLPAEKLDALVRGGAMLTKPVRDALIQQHIRTRANRSEDQAEAGMNGKPAEPGRSREELQEWIDGVARGEHPYAHIPQGSPFKPAGAEKLKKTTISGAGKFNGTYYHVPELKPEEIRKAARDKTNPQGALDALETKWSGKGPVELTSEDVETEQPKAETKASEPETKRLYHGSAQHGRYEGPAWFSTDEAYARDYRKDAELQYVDLPMDRWRELSGEDLENGIPGTSSIELDSSETGPRKPVESPKPAKLRLPKPAAKAITEIIDEATQADPTVTLDAVLRSTEEGQNIAQDLVDSGIITNSDKVLNPATKLLTTAGRAKLGDAMLEDLLSPELVSKTPPFIKEKLLASIGTLSVIAEMPEQWNLKPVLHKAISEYDRMFRGETPQDSGPVVTAIVKKLDEPVDDVRVAFRDYAIGSEMAKENPDLEIAGPFFSFNAAFGTELTPEQFDAGMKAEPKAIEKPSKEVEKQEAPALRTYEAEVSKYAGDPNPVMVRVQAESRRHAEAMIREQNPGSRVSDAGRVPDETPANAASPPALKVGDKVNYQTNKGKTRTGKVVRIVGEEAYIRDGDSTVKKASADLQVIADEAPAKPTPSKKQTMVDVLENAIKGGAGPKDYNQLKGTVFLFDGAQPDQLRMKQAQEAYEVAQNRVASGIASGYHSGTAKERFDKLVQMYEDQPNLSIRTSTSIENQAYSTPKPLAYIASRFAGISLNKSVYEPTAGTGSLLIEAGDSGIANELDQERAALLDAEGYTVTRNDASIWTPTQPVDAVVANPPFARLKGAVKVDGYDVTKLEHLISAKALSVLKDTGKACIIIGAGDRETPGKVTNEQKPFFNWLYSHYNVVTDFEVAGDLYSRQGASYPVRVIAIDGRVRSAKVSPAADTIPRLTTWGEVYEKATEYLGSNLEGKRSANVESDRTVGGQASKPGAVPAVDAGASGRGDQSQPEASTAGHGDDEHVRKPGYIQHTGTVPDPGVGSAVITVRSDGDVARSDRLAEGEPRTKVERRGTPKSDGLSADALADESNQFQDTYTPYSEKKDVAVMAPKAMKTPMRQAMERISDDVGDIDQWVADELGYPDVETLHDVFMGLQIDSIAAAIHNIQNGKAIVIADQTGVGKGRQAAAIIRWAELHGHIPIFMTAGAQLFSDMQRDLHDIGSGDTISPLLFNADATITDPITEKKIYGNNGSMRPVFDRIKETGELPRGRNAVYLTYSQINTSNNQQLALQRLAPKAVFILDEAHEAAGGDSNTGAFLQSVVAASNGVAFLSATWAKRPDNLGLYAGKTDISIAIPDKDKVADAIAAGGAPLQAVVSNQLAQAGQLVRRERSFDGISIENKVDEANQAQHERISNKVTEVLRAIVHADHMFHEHDFQDILQEAAESGESGVRNGVQINHMEFSSIVHNLVKQLLLALKAEASANEIIDAIKRGEKPVFALENTMGSFLDDYIASNNLKEGDLLKDLDYSRISNRALARTRYYTKKDQMGNSERVDVPLTSLSPAVRAAYDEAQALIDNLKVDLPVSPIDYIRDRVEKAGFKIAEITGRTLRIDYSGEVPKLSTVPGIEKKDRVNTASKFNNGGIDAIILNQAGAKGISLHASEKFRDQRPRVMIVGQPAGDVNIVMQMLGRINRTGQVVLPRYVLLAVALPAEIRPQMNLAKKMKSLNANVSSNTRAATSIKAVDLMNKYGDNTVAQYLVDNPEMMRALKLDVTETGPGKFTNAEGVSMKATGRSALLSVTEQQQFMDAITEAYTSYIDYLDETGQNDLEPRTYDFEAKETRSRRIFQGTDESSPFGQDAQYGEYSIKRQGKPFTPEEVEAQIAESFGPEAMKMHPRERDTMAARELATHMEELYKPYYDTLTTDGARDRAREIRQAGRALLNEYRVGVGLRVSVNDEISNGIVTKIEGAKKTSGNPYAPSSLKFTIAVNSAQRQIRIPGSQIRGITATIIERNSNVQQMFQDHIGDSRQKAKIITGNLLGAYGSLKTGVKGRIIAFTMADGTVKQGIIMPFKFDPATDVSNAYAMRTPEGAMGFLNSGGRTNIASTNQEVAVFGGIAGGLEIKTKTSKVAAGRFFLDPALRALVVGNDFASQGGLMKATIRTGQELAALKIIMNKIALYPTESNADHARSYDEKVEAAKPEKPRKSILSALASEEGQATVPAVVTKAVEYAATAGAATMDDLLKAAKLTGRTMKEAGREVVAALYPRALASDEAKNIMGRGIGHPALTLFRASQLMDGISKMFQGMPLDDQVEFVDRWQQGENQPTEDLQKAQQIMQSIMEGQRETERDAINLGRTEKNQIELSDKPNYFPNRYKVAPSREAPASEEDQIARIFAPSRRPLEGSKAFLKQQRYTLKEAVKDGAVPLGSPVEMLMRRIQEGAKFVAAKYIMHSFKETGMVEFLKRGKKMPAGYVKIDDKIAKVWRPVETLEGGTLYKETGEWVGQEDAMRLLNNYLSKDYVRELAIGRAFVALKNATTAIRLAWSPFHWLTITVQNFTSGMNIGLDRLYNQGLRDLDGPAAIKGLQEIGASMVAPYTAIKTGGRMIQYARNPDEFIESPEGQKFVEEFPDYPHLQRLLFSGGMRWGMPDAYRVSTGQGFVPEIESGHLGKATLKFFPWLTHVMTKPLFEHYIPRSKWNFAVRMLATKLEQYSSAIAAGDMTEEQLARDVASATDNRFGEFAFDNLYWKNTFKSLAQLTFRSVSWKAGSWLSAGKAVKEQFTSQAFDDRIYEKITEEADKFGWMKGITRRLPQLGTNAGGILCLFLFSSVLGSAVCQFATGHSPAYWAQQDAQKLGHTFEASMAFESLHPRTGHVDAHGEPVRLTFPTDIKDYEHAALHPGRYIHGSLSDMVANSWDTMQNSDSFGNYVYNPQDPAYKEFVQGAEYNLKGDFLPMSAESYARDNGPQDLPSKLERFSGILGGAPKEMDRSVALNRAMSEVHHDPRTPEEQTAYLYGKEHPTRHQILQAARERNMTYLDKVMKFELTYAEARDIYNNYATPAEQATLRPLMRAKQEAAIRKARAR